MFCVKQPVVKLYDIFGVVPGDVGLFTLPPYVKPLRPDSVFVNHLLVNEIFNGG